MNAEIDCTFFKLSDSTVSPIVFPDESDMGIHKFQLFASEDVLCEDGKISNINSNLGISCKIDDQYIKKFNGVLELFLSLDTNTFAFLQNDIERKEAISNRIILLTPLVHSISMEICLPPIFNSSGIDLHIKKDDSLAFIHFVLRGVPEINHNISEEQHKLEKLSQTHQRTLNRSLKVFCSKCCKQFTSYNKLHKHYHLKHADEK